MDNILCPVFPKHYKRDFTVKERDATEQLTSCQSVCLLEELRDDLGPRDHSTSLREARESKLLSQFKDGACRVISLQFMCI